MTTANKPRNLIHQFLSGIGAIACIILAPLMVVGEQIFMLLFDRPKLVFQAKQLRNDMSSFLSSMVRGNPCGEILFAAYVLCLAYGAAFFFSEFYYAVAVSVGIAEPVVSELKPAVSFESVFRLGYERSA